jgi:acetylornithine deacetylase/succinyl-diaminopimelate desuccinylase-like protein
MNVDVRSFALEELKKLVRIPSISFEGFDPKQLTRSAEATADLLKRVGFQNVELKSIEGCFPYVVGERIVDPKARTILLYAHHDVQPPGREELWKSPPFEPTLRNGRLYGRGTADDKAGILVHAAALFALKDYVNSSKVNLKIIIEGEEEVGSSHLLQFLSQNKEQLKSDVIIVTDTGNIKEGVPSLTVSLRGLVCVEVEVRSLKAPLHSGMWGGGIVDPTQVLIKMIAAMTNDKGEIQLKSVQKGKRRSTEGIPVSHAEFCEQAGVLKSQSVPEDFWHRIWYEPSFSVNAIQASSEKLANNIICDRAFARMGIRVTRDQSAKDVAKEWVEKLRSLAPSTVEVNIKLHEPSDAWETDPQSSKNRWAFAAAEKALERAFQHKAIYMGCGASIPFIGPFEEALKAPVITLGVEDPLTLAHSENESLLLEDFYKAIEAEVFLFEEIAKAI